MTRWAFLDDLVSQSGGIAQLPPAIHTELAERLREAMLARDPREIDGLAKQLEELIRSSVRDVAPETAAAARRAHEATGTPAAEAYALGHLTFAHLLAAHVARRRAAVDFEEQIAGETFVPYLKALARDDLTNTELAALVNQRPETISRNLRKLRELGAVDFRREGTRAVNFLTPLARRIARRHLGRPTRTRLTAAVRGWASAEQQELRPVMRDAPSFAREVSLADA